jgi:protoporphyrinogen oxidase
VSKPVTILGAGLAGLLCAMRLAESGHKVLVLERQSVAGGLCRPLELAGRTWDRYYHHIMRAETAVQDLIAELGLSGELVWQPVRQGNVRNRKVQAFDRALDTIQLGFSLKDLIGDASFGLELLRLRDIAALDSISALDWVSRHQSARRVELLWKPLLEKKFGEHAAKVSAWWLADRIVCRASSKRRFRRGEILGHLVGGYARLTDRLEERCRELGVEIRLGTSVESIQGSGGRITALQTETGAIEIEGEMVSTLPFPVLEKLIDPDAGIDVAPLKEPVYMSCLCVALVLERPLSEYYWLSNLDVVPFAGLIEQNALSMDDGHLVYLPRYLPMGAKPSREVFEEAERTAIDWLSDLFPTFEESQVTMRTVAFDPDCQPVFFTGHLRDRPGQDLKAANLIATDPILDFPNQTRSMSATIRRAEAIIKKLRA